jgi:hypothetical protein
MRLPRVRFTVRRMMIVVLCLGVVLHLTVATWRVHRSGGVHLHSAIFENAFGPGWGVAVREQPFWPAFWRRSTGLAWGDQRTCLMGDNALMEKCELANPEIREPLGPNTFAAIHTKEQIELFKD